MPRNSFDDSLGRFGEIASLAKIYKTKFKYEDNNPENLTEYRKNNLKKIFKIERARECLAEPYRTIIDNTFFVKKDLYWWIDFYSKSTYYRLRGKAIRTFLDAYSYDV